MIIMIIIIIIMIIMIIIIINNNNNNNDNNNNQGFIQRGGCPGISPPQGPVFPPPQEFHITMS